MWLFLVFVAVPIIEIGLFIRVGNWLGLWPTLGIVIVTAFLGTVLVRNQGLTALSSIKNNLNAFQDPTEALAHGAMILVSGILLLTPGFFTDALGFALLIPPIRVSIFHFVKARVKVQSFVQPQQHQQPSETVIDGEFTEINEDEISDKTPGNSGWTRH
ncbi:MAG: FxsA family protein [Litoreibacter sp.]